MDREKKQNQSFVNWDERLDLALKNLPEQSAPAGLLPLVMAQIQAREETKRQKRSWGEWPLWFRVSTAVLALVLIVYLSTIGFQLYETRVIPVFSRTAQTLMTVCAAITGVFGDLCDTLGSRTLQYAVIAISLLLFGMYLTCIGLGTFIYRTVRR